MITPPPLCLTVGMRHLCWYAVLEKERGGVLLFFFGISQRDLGLNLLGRLAAVLKVFHLQIIFLNMEWWTLNCLEMTFPDWWATMITYLRSSWLYKLIALFFSLISMNFTDTRAKAVTWIIEIAQKVVSVYLDVVFAECFVIHQKVHGL